MILNRGCVEPLWQGSKVLRYLYPSLLTDLLLTYTVRHPCAVVRHSTLAAPRIPVMRGTAELARRGFLHHYISTVELLLTHTLFCPLF